MTTGDSEQIYAAVRDRYASAARATTSSACCGQGGTPTGVVTGNLYEKDETDALPSDAVAASLGCGNPTMLADLQPAKSSWTSDQAEGSTCCCRRVGSVPAEWHTALT